MTSSTKETSMHRKIQLLLSLYGPPAVLIGLAMFIGSAFPSVENGLFAGVLTRVESSLCLALLAGAGIWVTVGAFVIWQHETEKTPPCPCCGGPLGWEILGRWGTFRRCWACWQRISQRRYA
jgi:hypothetical protein